LVEAPLPLLSDGDVRVRNIFLSLDPTNRLWISGEETYFAAQCIGDVVRGGAIGIVEESANSVLKVGDLVSGLLGWQLYYTGPGRRLSLFSPTARIALLAYHGVLGAVGLTDYFGLLDIGRPERGEAVLVSAAAGAVGSLVGQIAKIKGCEVVGLAGSDDKCQWLTQELDFDAAINYRKGNLAEQLKQVCSKGVDIYFDNVGGEILDAALGCINRKGRVVTCGLISQYNAATPAHNLSNLSRFLMQRARMEAFIVVVRERPVRLRSCAIGCRSNPRRWPRSFAVPRSDNGLPEIAARRHSAGFAIGSDQNPWGICNHADAATLCI
jgi:NADPH-dependent curcumin reductase